MPKSQRKIAARTRALYTGEAYEAARAGIARDHSAGLDACLPEQREFRALLALGFFNQGVDYSTPAGWHMSTLSAYTITASPRFERLVLITDVPDNVAPYLLPRPNSLSRLPGLRLKERRGNGTYIARHLPTNAQLVITRNPTGRPTGARNNPYRDFFTTSTPLSPDEREQLTRVPDISKDAQRLLAGVFCRISVTDPRGKWAIGNWFYDPLDRPGRLDSARQYGGGRKLHGSGNDWELLWNSYPYPDDLAAAMTDPIVGVPGAKVLSSSNHLVITLGSATLSLRSRHT
ncbi:hypothetical protein Q3V23_10825 [Streptomyces sp. VNUA116]|uniref:hypothetical protein n=1 Tax=Streptomyces sp. VNUA116 TaxID=3062449 RepID=UPI00267598A0|nr:hypothetical protein [Streptomyces sp. VNUA116]WKU44537.1 hypothetical protein Q3V23_10825 [Streptomyces sp. VNUA116]